MHYKVHIITILTHMIAEYLKDFVYNILLEVVGLNVALVNNCFLFRRHNNGDYKIWRYVGA